MDRSPTADGRTVHPEPFVKGCFRQLLDWVRNVMPQPRQVGEAEVENLNVVSSRKLEHGFGVSHISVQAKETGKCSRDFSVLRQSNRRKCPAFSISLKSKGTQLEASLAGRKLPIECRRSSKRSRNRLFLWKR